MSLFIIKPYGPLPFMVFNIDSVNLNFLTNNEATGLNFYIIK